MMNDRVDPALDRSAADGVTFGPKEIITHAGLIGLEIPRSLAYLVRPRALREVQFFQCSHDLIDVTIPQEVQLLLYPLFPLRGLVSQDGFAHFPQPPTGMGPIHNLHRLWKVQIRDALDPRRPVVDRTQSLAMIYPTSQSFGILMQRHRIRIP